MGIFDFLKSRKTETEKEKISFDKLEEWLKEKQKQNQLKEASAIKAVSSLVEDLIFELKAKQEILQKIDLKDRKAEERLKLVVLKNLSNYSDYLGGLIEGLENLDKNSFTLLIKNIDDIFLDFRKKSSLSFEKATILIGDELGSIKDLTRIFFKELKDLLVDKKELISALKIVDSAKNKLQEIKKEEKSGLAITAVLSGIENELKDLENKNNSLKNDMEKLEEARSI